MEDYIDSIDNDLSELEDEVYGADFLEIECPYCGGLLEIDANLFDDEDLEIACPECGETIRYDDIDSYLYDEYDEEDDEDEGEDDAPQLKNKGKGKLHPVK